MPTPLSTPIHSAEGEREGGGASQVQRRRGAPKKEGFDHGFTKKTAFFKALENKLILKGKWR